MKKSLRALLYIVLVLVFATSTVVKSLRWTPNQSSLDKKTAAIDDVHNKLHKHHKGEPKRRGGGRVGKEEYPGGSSIPDCTHACGACYPCKRVKISFKCSASIESCPIVYRCTCKGKYYPVPSN